jgi:hypothetical protein
MFLASPTRELDAVHRPLVDAGRQQVEPLCNESRERAVGSLQTDKQLLGYAIRFQDGATKVGETEQSSELRAGLSPARRHTASLIKVTEWRFFEREDKAEWEHTIKEVFKPFLLPGDTECFNDVPYDTLLRMCDLHARRCGGVEVKKRAR